MHIACFFIYSLCVEVIARDFQPIGTVNPSKYIPAQKQISKSRNGMVTTQHFIATRVGEKILSKGGNAYDAAIAVGFTLAVVLPRAGNIGGGGFMVMHDSVSNQNYSIDYREMAPDKSFTKMYLQEDGSFNKEKLSTFGYLASGVPGTVAGFWEVHQKFGSLDWELLLEDAIFYAENGFEITPYMGDILIKYKEKLSYYEPTKKIFMEHNPNFTGSILVQKDLANTLKIIAKKGKDGFYKGEVAKKIAEQMQKNGGLITENDLITYKPKWRKPLISNYRNNKIITMGPPSSGGVHIIQMLNILENYNLKNMGHNTTEYINLLAEVMKYAYADRSKHLGDPDFFDVPVSEITNKQYAATIKSKIKIGESKPSSKILPGSFDDNESIETTHFSVADKNGNVVSSTYTLNSTFGSGVTIEGTGILMNNEMDDFSAAPGIPNQFGLLGATANEIQPKKRPLSSMTPTIVMKNDQLFFTTGSPGGSRIISAVLQSILNIIDFEMDLEEANEAKRIHHQWQPDILQIEFSLNEDIQNELEKLNYNVQVISPATCLQLIMLKNQTFYGYGDFRRPDAFASGDIYD
ncbi:MAG: gamma-glutamyltransferase [Proteobacteria bacterium]|nr:gamma-glutamyltransferase [Pseudomonadota bacterium]